MIQFKYLQFRSFVERVKMNECGMLNSSSGTEYSGVPREARLRYRQVGRATARLRWVVGNESPE